MCEPTTTTRADIASEQYNRNKERRAMPQPSDNQSCIIRIYRTHSDHYTIVSNEVLQNLDLTYGARGLLTYLLSKPNGWELRLGDLINEGHDGRDRVRTLLRELERNRYLTRTRVRGANGRFFWICKIYDLPQQPDAASVAAYFAAVVDEEFSSPITVVDEEFPPPIAFVGEAETIPTSAITTDGFAIHGVRTSGCGTIDGFSVDGGPAHGEIPTSAITIDGFSVDGKPVDIVITESQRTELLDSNQRENENEKMKTKVSPVRSVVDSDSRSDHAIAAYPPTRTSAPARSRTRDADALANWTSVAAFTSTQAPASTLTFVQAVSDWPINPVEHVQGLAKGGSGVNGASSARRVDNGPPAPSEELVEPSGGGGDSPPPLLVTLTDEIWQWWDALLRRHHVPPDALDLPSLTVQFTRYWLNRGTEAESLAPQKWLALHRGYMELKVGDYLKRQQHPPNRSTPRYNGGGPRRDNTAIDPQKYTTGKYAHIFQRHREEYNAASVPDDATGVH